MKSKITLILLAATFLIGIAILSSCGKSDKDAVKNNKTTEEKQVERRDSTILAADGKYFCTMHPTQQSNDPNAKCPICKMKMVSKADYNKQMLDEHEALEQKNQGKKDLIHFEVNLSVVKSDACEKLIESALKKDPGIVDFHVDVLSKVIHMYIDKSKTTKSNVEKLISDAGFDANNTKANPEAVNKLPAECR
jgi:mercuric ion binding protein